MKKYLLIIVLLVLMACNRTQVIRLDGSKQYVTSTDSIQNIVNPMASGSNASNAAKVSNQNGITTTGASNNVYAYNNNAATSSNSANSSGDYTITSCCNYGRMEVHSNLKENDLSIEEIKSLLLKIYYDNCNKYPNYPKHSLYLVFSDYLSGDSRNHLNSFVGINYNELVIKGRFQEPSFKNCLISN